MSPAGLADIAAGVPMAADSLFWIASQTKPITATALMMLVDAGEVCLNDPALKYLPEFAGQMVVVEADEEHRLLRKPAHAPTIRELLSHTSGLPFCSAVEHPTFDNLPLHSAVRGQSMTALNSEPGSRYAYANAGFSVAGRIVEVVSGLAYEDFLQQRLFAPLGMTDTTFRPTESQVARLARAYRPAREGRAPEETPVDQLSYPLTDRSRRFPFPGGGLFSTARDCAQFCRMILCEGELDGRRYVSAGAVREMSRRQTPASLPENYGLGWDIRPDGRFGHGGALCSNMEVDPRAGLVKVMLVKIVGGQGREAPLWPAFLEDTAARHGTR